MRYKIYSKWLLLPLLIAFLAIGCKEESSAEDNYTGLLSFKIKGHENTFVIGADKSVTSKTKLRYGTDATKLVAEFTLAGNSKAQVGGNDVKSGNTFDFSKDVKLVTMAINGTAKKEYTIKVKVSEVNPEEVSWNKLSPGISAIDYDQNYQIAQLGDKYYAAAMQKKAGWPSPGALVVYSSKDGKAWTKETLTGGLALQSGANTVYGAFNLFVKDDKLHLIAPLKLGSSSFINTVFTSTDGIAWTKKTANTTKKLPVANFRIAVLDKKIVALGGQGVVFGNYQGEGKKDVYISTDGMAWDKTADALAEGLVNPAVLLHTGKNKKATIFHIGGAKKEASGAAALVSDIYTSTDGTTYTKLTALTGLPALEGASAISLHGNIYVIGGFKTGGSDESSASSEIYVSKDDGATFAKVETFQELPTEFVARGYASVMVDKDNAVIIAGGGDKKKII